VNKKASALHEGDLVAIVAPSGAVHEEAMNRGIKVLEGLGLRVKVGKHALDRWGYLAGSDGDRAADFAEAWMDPEVKAVICARGGYGAMRVLPYLDFESLKQHRKILVGYSDITALHLAFWREMRLVTFHGPMVESGEESGLNDPYNLASFKKALFGYAEESEVRSAGEPADRPTAQLAGASPVGSSATSPAEPSIESPVKQPSEPPTEPSAELSQELPMVLPDGHALTTVEEGRAEGVIVGGNLSLVASTIGSRWELDTHGKILFLEEVGEKPYRVDRMLCQLALSGRLAAAAGYILGDFTDCEPSEGSPSFSVAEVLGQYFAGTGKPCIAGMPAGHGRYKATIPFGTKVRISTGVASSSGPSRGSADRPSVCYLESPTRRS
jgi:muramoyltetrapeptide carboxypeptidase